MSAERIVKKSTLEQMTAFLSLIFAVILISIIAIPQVLRAVFRLIYCNRRKSKDIRGKLAIVTGTEDENELMKFIVLELVSRGCNLAIIGDVEDKTEIKFLNELGNDNVNVKSLKVDCSNVEEIKRVYKDLTDEYGSIDVLINAPKLINLGAISSQSCSEISTIINESFSRIMFLTLSMIDTMKSQPNQGHIISISPITGLSIVPTNYPSFSIFYSFMKSISRSIEDSNLNNKIKASLVLPCCFINGDLISRFIDRHLSFKSINSRAIAAEVVESIFSNETLIEIPNNLTNFKRVVNYIFKIVNHK